MIWDDMVLTTDVPHSYLSFSLEMKYTPHLALSFFIGGCGNRPGGGGYPTPSPSTYDPITYTAPRTTLNPLDCGGRNIGTYAWSQDYWRGSDSTLLTFLSSDIGRQWACGDLSVNVADYSNPDQIHDSGALVSFIQNYRLIVRNMKTVVWITYGDVVEKSAEKMLQFTQTFFIWASSIPADVAVSMGTIGISYDVEHIDPEATRNALQLAQQLRTQTNFKPGNLLIQHTIEGDPNVVGTGYVMQYADSALAMVYRNYMHDPTGKYQDDSNILNRLLWMLTSQCVHCLDEAYVLSNYKAKITVMVEAACRMGASCGKVSMCAFDGDEQGAYYMYNILEQMEQELSPLHISASLKKALFNPSTPYTVHNWEWFRCFAPFSSVFTYASCADYHQEASACRNL
jgi:hypothetical protein